MTLSEKVKEVSERVGARSGCRFSFSASTPIASVTRKFIFHFEKLIAEARNACEPRVGRLIAGSSDVAHAIPHDEYGGCNNIIESPFETFDWEFRRRSSNGINTAKWLVLSIEILSMVAAASFCRMLENFRIPSVLYSIEFANTIFGVDHI